MSEVGVAQLRQGLKEWIARVQGGDEVIITDRGKPVARLTQIGVPTALDRLVAEGRVSQPKRPRPPARGLDRIQGRGAVSQYVTDEREARRP
ncbi:MAG: type II toxin-antitoxin system prevent-host-death family antitoxin [Actinomycetota bacterium]|jgi:prevent-host-death family protein|nr:type II toxin-antitoxin system prevent-host-death family antitoxin [Actinomycetota bacterium]